jgi:hypothetical protein
MERKPTEQSKAKKKGKWESKKDERGKRRVSDSLATPLCPIPIRDILSQRRPQKGTSTYVIRTMASFPRRIGVRWNEIDSDPGCQQGARAQLKTKESGMHQHGLDTYACPVSPRCSPLATGISHDVLALSAFSIQCSVFSVQDSTS